MVATDTAGRGEDLWFGDILGIGDTRTKLYLFDIGLSHIVTLTDRFEHATVFGREGGGPGEFESSTIHQGGNTSTMNWLSVNDSDLVVFDTRRLSLFSTDGTFKRYLNALGVSLSLWPFKKIEITDHGTFLLRDLLMDVVGGFKPEMELWQLGRQEAELRTAVRTIAAPGRRPSDQAVPTVAFSNQCAFFTDGSSDSIVKLALDTNILDTLPLPHIHPANRELEMHDRKAEIEALKKMSRMGGFSFTAGKKDPPTALWWWTEAIVDPDGYLWLRLWAPRELRDRRSEALIINPDTGTWKLDTIPGFPRAFGRAGVYYREVRDPDDRTPLVVRYEMTAR